MTITPTTLERRTLLLLEHQPGITAAAAAQALEAQVSRVRSALAELRRYGLATSTGPPLRGGRPRWWATDAGSTVLADDVRVRTLAA